MNIQSNHYGSFAYQGPNKVTSLRPANAPSTTMAGSMSPANFGLATEKVSISAAAQSLAANEKPPTQARTLVQQRLLANTASDPQAAEKVASDMAHSKSQILYNLNLSKPDEPLRLSTTGEHVDGAFKDKFAAEAAQVDAQQLALYNIEKAKGTDPREILSKMFDLTNRQSQNYLNATAWAEKRV